MGKAKTTSEASERERLVAACEEQKALSAEYTRRWEAESAGLEEEAARSGLRDALMSEYERRKEALDAQITQLVSSLDVRPGSEKKVMTRVDLMPFRSQGYGADKYARTKAEMIAAEAAEHGVESEVVPIPWPPMPDNQGPAPKGPMGYQVVTYVKDESDAWLLALKPRWELKETVRQCWKRGVNPRVYLPHLPHGFESEVGIDYQGNDLEVTGE